MSDGIEGYYSDDPNWFPEEHPDNQSYQDRTEGQVGHSGDVFKGTGIKVEPLAPCPLEGCPGHGPQPMFSKRHYEAIARVLVGSEACCYLDFPDFFADMLEKDNHNFNRQKFLEACNDA